MKCNGRDVDIFQRQVLNNESIHPDVIESGYKTIHRLYFLVVDDGVDCDIDLGREDMCELA